MKPGIVIGIVQSSPDAQGIVRLYCSSGRGVLMRRYVLVCPAGAVRPAVRELGGGCLYICGGLDRPQLGGRPPY